MRTLFKTLTFAGLAALIVSLGGCDITSLNDNPNQPTDAEPPKLLSNTQAELADQYWQDYPGGFWVRYAQYWTTNQYTDADRYEYASSRPGSLNSLWGNFYLNLNNLQEIIRINRESPDQAQAFGPNDNQIAVAKIMQAWTLKTMTDMFGPIPLSDALDGRSDSDAFTPEYDGQEAVYDSLLTMLTDASQRIDTGTSALSSGDKMYDGDMSKWKKFANALKMRVAITMADKEPDVAEEALEEAIDAGAFESNDDNATMAFDSESPFQNPFYENREVSGRQDWAATESMLDPMNETNDPRRSAYYTEEDGEFIGFPYGLSQGDAQSLFTSASFSIPSERVASDPEAPAIFMLYDEVLFIKAEAALRSDLDVPNISMSGQELYEDAIEASMQYWGASDAEISDYFDQSGVPAQVNSSNYEQVLGTQKWIAQYLQGVPGWTTFRRMDFEGVLSPPDGDPGQEEFGRSFAVRMVYPNDEFSLNESNVNTAISDLLGGDGASEDNQGVLLWWDVDPPPTP
ncbi:MAG: SusD/RagB family nutrient-binding outer membrane lipoprotein [Salinivenus sp.]